jgi:tRNA-splicing ligase RtcB
MTRNSCHLAWLDMSTSEGQEYWAAMNLMGQYAHANHEVIHRNVTKLAGAKALATIENHHNFAWLEEHGGKQLYVHRKGRDASGSRCPGNHSRQHGRFPLRGTAAKAKQAALNSAADGAGRVMSRTAAKKQFRWGPWPRLTPRAKRSAARGRTGTRFPVSTKTSGR